LSPAALTRDLRKIVTHAAILARHPLEIGGGGDYDLRTMANTIAGIILAAGESSRMGRTKALLPIGAETFVAHIVRTLVSANVRPIVVVCGTALLEIRAALEAAGLADAVTTIENVRRVEGQVTSIVAGLDALEPADVAAALVCPVDSPLFLSDTVTSLVTAFQTRHALIVRPTSGSRHGHPALFSQLVFDDLRCADPAVGARAVLSAHRDHIEDVPVADAGAFIDIDTPEEYARVVGNR
jgi:molybdenum cofactor cytidylyltransferase